MSSSEIAIELRPLLGRRVRAREQSVFQTAHGIFRGEDSRGVVVGAVVSEQGFGHHTIQILVEIRDLHGPGTFVAHADLGDAIFEEDSEPEAGPEAPGAVAGAGAGLPQAPAVLAAWIQTWSGLAFDYTAPTKDMVCATDIAQSLSKLCRYAGHCFAHYSVAEHCCHLHDWMKQHHPDRPYLALGALLHDAHEAYLVDLPHPLKRMFPPEAMAFWKDLERKVDEAIAEAFRISPDLFHAPEIQEIDKRIWGDEREILFGPSPRPWAHHGEKLGVKIQALERDRALTEWLERLRSHEPVDGAFPW